MMKDHVKEISKKFEKTKKENKENNKNKKKMKILKIQINKACRNKKLLKRSKQTL